MDGVLEGGSGSFVDGGSGDFMVDGGSGHFEVASGFCHFVVEGRSGRCSEVGLPRPRSSSNSFHSLSSARDRPTMREMLPPRGSQRAPKRSQKSLH